MSDAAEPRTVRINALCDEAGIMLMGVSGVTCEITAEPRPVDRYAAASRLLRIIEAAQTKLSITRDLVNAELASQWRQVGVQQAVTVAHQRGEPVTDQQTCAPVDPRLADDQRDPGDETPEAAQ